MTESSTTVLMKQGLTSAIAADASGGFKGAIIVMISDQGNTCTLSTPGMHRLAERAASMVAKALPGKN